MREVKAQRFIIDQRTFLRHMGAEHLAQRRVHQVRRGVVETDTLTASLIYVGLHRVTHFQCAAGDFTDMTNSRPYFCVSLTAKEKPAPLIRLYRPPAAGLRIERGLIRITTASRPALTLSTALPSINRAVTLPFSSR
nr:Uncharacterised protein [Klebsiella pneumoniae]